MSKKRSELIRKLKAPVELTDEEDSTLGEATYLIEKLKLDQMRPKPKLKPKPKPKPEDTFALNLKP